MAIDIIKHSFIAKFNDIKPIAYSEFLEDLCKQVSNQPSNIIFFLCKCHIDLYSKSIALSCVPGLWFYHCTWVFASCVTVEGYKHLFALMEKERE